MLVGNALLSDVPKSGRYTCLLLQGHFHSLTVLKKNPFGSDLVYLSLARLNLESCIPMNSSYCIQLSPETEKYSEINQQNGFNFLW